MREPYLAVDPVPDSASRHRMWTWNPNVHAGRFWVVVDQPDGWTCTVEVLKAKGGRPFVAALTIEPTEWVTDREGHKEDPENYTLMEDWPGDVPGEGLTRSAVQKMSWEKWRKAATDGLGELAIEELQVRGIELADLLAMKPRKLGSHGRRTDVEKANIALQYVIAVEKGIPTAAHVADFIFEMSGSDDPDDRIEEKTVRNLIGQLRKEGLLTQTKGRKPGGRLTPKTIDLLNEQWATERGR